MKRAISIFLLVCLLFTQSIGLAEMVTLKKSELASIFCGAGLGDAVDRYAYISNASSSASAFAGVAMSVAYDIACEYKDFYFDYTYEKDAPAVIGLPLAYSNAIIIFLRDKQGKYVKAIFDFCSEKVSYEKRKYSVDDALDYIQTGVLKATSISANDLKAQIVSIQTVAEDIYKKIKRSPKNGQFK